MLHLSEPRWAATRLGRLRFAPSTPAHTNTDMWPTTLFRMLFAPVFCVSHAGARERCRTREFTQNRSVRPISAPVSTAFCTCFLRARRTPAPHCACKASIFTQNPANNRGRSAAQPGDPSFSTACCTCFLRARCTPAPHCACKASIFTQNLANNRDARRRPLQALRCIRGDIGMYKWFSVRGWRSRPHKSFQRVCWSTLASGTACKQEQLAICGGCTRSRRSRTPFGRNKLAASSRVPRN